MLKAIQIFGGSSSSGVGLVSLRLKKPCCYTHSRNHLSLIPTCTKASSLKTSPLIAKPIFQPRKGLSSCYRASKMSSSTHSQSYPDGGSSSSLSSVAVQSTGSTRKINFCQSCGGRTKHEVPDGEEKPRAICTSCGKISYENPKMVVGCLIEHDNKILLCKRKIHPSYGLWTLPAGYMEIGESAADGAIRETWEEATAEAEIISPFAQLDIPLIGQTYIIFLAKLKTPHFSPGPESSECQLFALDDIPFDSLAFSSMLVTLKLFIEDTKNGGPKFHYGIINKRPGTSPSQIHAYTLDHHLQS